MPEIEKSIVSYPERGKWGSGSWNGNTSGHLIVDLIDTYHPKSVLDPMEGSGTTREVCKDLGVEYKGYDIKDGHDIMSPIHQQRMVEDRRDGYDMIFLHPPYWAMIHYSNSPADLSNGPYSLYLTRMHAVMKFCSRMLTSTGFIALLLADFRYFGRTYFLTDDITSIGAMMSMGLDKEARIIKIQHKTNSRGKVDHPGGFTFVHEYVTILRKRGAFSTEITNA